MSEDFLILQPNNTVLCPRCGSELRLTVNVQYGSVPFEVRDNGDYNYAAQDGKIVDDWVVYVYCVNGDWDMHDSDPMNIFDPERNEFI